VIFPEKFDPWRDRRAAAHSWFGAQFMQTGTVKWFNAAKGLVSLRRSMARRMFRPHLRRRALGLGTLKEGQKVSFDLERGQQGKTSAVNLKAA
jgi:CspA family cold shock protein